MFGYVKPKKEELLVREYEFYRATYCGICRAMKRHTGALSNVTLSYDSVFLALVRMLYIDDSDFGAERRRCIAHPLKKRSMLKENPALEYVARAFAILTYHKLKDDIHDEKGARRVAFSMANPILSSAKVKANLPSLSQLISKKLAKIRGLEDSLCDSVDRPAALFGELLGEVFGYGIEDKLRLVPYTLGYHLGKFIYCADAAEDYEKDRMTGSYNPYVLYYGGKPLTTENRATIKCALIYECKGMESAVNLLPFGTRTTIQNIINNVIYLGLPERIRFLDNSEEGNFESRNAKNTEK